MIIRTIEDMENLYYGAKGSQFIMKSDSPMLSSTQGVYNPKYGALVWSQLNQESNIWGCMPKYVWDRSGWRVLKSRAEEKGKGVAEDGTIPDSIKPEFQQISTKPKTYPTVFEASEVHQFLVDETEDDAVGNMAQLRVIMGIHHKEMLNRMLFHEVSKDAITVDANRNSTNDEDNWFNFESLDRIISSKRERDAVTDKDGWYNPYALSEFTRDSANTVYDSYVSMDDDLNVREYSDDLILDLLQNVRERGGVPSVLVTGYDTYSEIVKEYTTFVRYTPLATKEISITVNGVDTPKGYPVGMNVPELYGIPIILTKDAPKNADNDELSRIFCLDISDVEGHGNPRLGVQIAKPTQYFEAGMTSGNPFAINKFSDKGMYRTMGETICRAMRMQGKIRDIGIEESGEE